MDTNKVKQVLKDIGIWSSVLLLYIGSNLLVLAKYILSNISYVWANCCKALVFKRRYGNWELSFDYDPEFWAILEIDYNDNSWSYGKDDQEKTVSDIGKVFYFSLFRTRFYIKYWLDRSLSEYLKRDTVNNITADNNNTQEHLGE